MTLGVAITTKTAVTTTVTPVKIMRIIRQRLLTNGTTDHMFETDRSKIGSSRRTENAKSNKHTLSGLRDNFHVSVVGTSMTRTRYSVRLTSCHIAGL